MVLHKFRTRYFDMFEIEMSELKLNRSALKFIESWISKTMLKLPMRELLTKCPFGKFSIQGVELGLWFKKLNQLEVIKIKLGL